MAFLLPQTIVAALDIFNNEYTCATCSHPVATPVAEQNAFNWRDNLASDLASSQDSAKIESNEKCNNITAYHIIVPGSIALYIAACFLFDLDGCGMLNKVLIVAPAHAYLLLPQRIFPDDNGSDSLCYQKVNDTLTGSVQVVIDLPVPMVSDTLHLPGDALSIFFRKALCQLFHALIVPLVPRFEHPTVNQSREKTLSV
jgi:hypothetical protein